MNFLFWSENISSKYHHKLKKNDDSSQIFYLYWAVYQQSFPGNVYEQCRIFLTTKI